MSASVVGEEETLALVMLEEQSGRWISADRLLTLVNVFRLHSESHVTTRRGTSVERRRDGERVDPGKS